MRTLAISLAAALALACASDAPALWRSGTRLRARVQRADSGAAVFLTWHDTMLESDCTFVATADWSLYCVPQTGSAYLDDTCTALGAVSFFGDLPRYTLMPSATSAALAALGGLAGISYGSVLPSTCTTPPEMLDVREVDLAHVASVAFRRDETGACVPISLALTAAPILEPVPLATFVSATLTRAPVGSRLLQYVLHASDGAEQRLPVFDDPVLSSLCRFADPQRGGACIPEEAAHAMTLASEPRFTSFADASCTTPSAGYSPTCTRPPRWTTVSAYTDDACAAPTTELHDIGSEVSATFRLDPATGACEAYDPTSPGGPGGLGALAAGRPFEVGASLGTGRLAIGTLGLAGSGALRVRTIEVEGVPVAGVSLRVPDGRSCWSVPFSDHVVRCVPGPAVETTVSPWLDFFEDEGCTAPIGETETTCAGPPQMLIEHGADASVVEVLRIEALPSGTRYQLVDGACVPATPRSPRSVFYRVGDAVPLESFPVVTTVVE